MDCFTLILLSLGLAADAFAVSITNGMCSRKITPKNALLTGITFGFFQAIMPVLGFYLGKSFSGIVYRFQHWVALFLLCAIGINMLADTVYHQENVVVNRDKTIFTPRNLILQGIATSIDALAAGISFAVLESNIIYAASLIGMITMTSCFFGVYIGRIFGFLLGIRAKLIGGIILILIGLKIFFENQFL